MNLLLAIIIFVLYLHMNKKVNSTTDVPAMSVEALALPQEYVGSFTKRIVLAAPQIKAMTTTPAQVLLDACFAEPTVATIKYSIRELKALASAAKVKNYGSMKKAELMIALSL